MTDIVFSWISHYGYFAIFFMLMLGIVGLPVPEEFLLTFTGYLVSAEVLRPIPAVCTTFFGSVCGITVSYSLGRRFGLPLVERYGRFVWLNTSKIAKVRAWFENLGKWSLFVGYFLPGFRHFSGFVAGTSRLRMPVFARYAYMGALFWTVTFVCLGFLLGNEWMNILEHIHKVLIYGTVSLVGIAGCFLAFRKMYAKDSTI